MDKKGAVVGSSLYVDDQLVGKDIEFTLPEIASQSADVQAMGAMSVPLIGLLENMQASIKQIGIDVSTGKINKLEKHTIEIRWVQEVVKSDGSVSVESCKAFMRALPATALPAISVANGSISEVEGTYNVSRFQLFVNGQEVCLVDRIAGILQFDGVDYYKQVADLL